MPAHVTSHPEECPKCGKLTRHWFYVGNTTYVECEYCGYSGTKSKYAIRMLPGLAGDRRGIATELASVGSFIGSRVLS